MIEPYHPVLCQHIIAQLMLYDTKTHIPKSLSSECEYEVPRKTMLLILACCQNILITRKICYIQIKMNYYNTIMHLYIMSKYNADYIL